EGANTEPNPASNKNSSREVSTAGAAEEASSSAEGTAQDRHDPDALLASPRLLDVRGLGARGVQGEGAAEGPGARAAAHPRPDHGPALGRAQGDAGPDGEAGGAGGPDGDVHPGRGGDDVHASAPGGGHRERGGRRGGAADVRDATGATRLRRGAGPAGGRAPTAVGDRPA